MVNNLVAHFEEYHSITMPKWWPRGLEILSALLSSRDATHHALASATESVIRTEPSFGLLFQLAERTYEHVAASLVCFSTKNAATAEVAARVAIESSVNIRFILSGDRNALALSWLRAYITRDSKDIDQWDKLLDASPLDHKSENQTRIATRRKLNGFRRDFLSQSEREFGSFGPVDLQARWPNIAERFEAIGEALAYRTTYSRLSSQTHADAEDTINYIVFTCIGDEPFRLRMSEETIAFSEFLVAYGIHFYLLAMKTLCESFGLSIPPIVEASTKIVMTHMHEIGEAWSW